MAALLVFAPVPSGTGTEGRAEASPGPGRIGRARASKTRPEPQEARFTRRSQGLLGATLWAGPRSRVDNARVWGRRERLQRLLGPAHSRPPGKLSPAMNDDRPARIP